MQISGFFSLYISIIFTSCITYRLQNFRIGKHLRLSKFELKSDKNSPDTLSSYSVGFSKKIGYGYSGRTHIISGDNSVEHGVNIIEQDINQILTKANHPKKVHIICGWNCARVDTLMWELEPRGFTITVNSVTDEPTITNVVDIMEYVLDFQPDIIIAMGGASVMDTSKLVWTLFANLVCPQQSNTTPIHKQLVSILDALNYTIDVQNNNNDQLVMRDRIQFITIPTSPSLGAELSPTAAVVTDSTDISDPSPSTYFRFKEYIMTAPPTLCLYQPSLLALAPMELLHQNIVCLQALAMDAVLCAENSLSEYLAWSAVEKLVPILDAAAEASNGRSTARDVDPLAFHEITVHDDLKDHNSQYSRRYGQGLSPSTMACLSEVCMVVASARANVRSRPSPLQFLVDTVSATVGVESSYTSRMAFLAPHYFMSVCDWAEEAGESSPAARSAVDVFNRGGGSGDDEISAAVTDAVLGGSRIEGRDSLREGTRLFGEMSREERRRRLRDSWQKNTRPGGAGGALEEAVDRAAARTKLTRLSALFSKSKALNAGLNSDSLEFSNPNSSHFRAQLERFADLSRSICGPEHAGRDYRLPRLSGMRSPRDCHAVRSAMQEACGAVPGSQLSVEQIFNLFTRFDDLVDASTGESHLEPAGPYIEEDEEDDVVEGEGEEEGIEVGGGSSVAAGEGSVEVVGSVDGEGGGGYRGGAEAERGAVLRRRWAACSSPELT